MTRRVWLVLGVMGLVVSAASRVTAAGPAQVEPEAYAGSTVGAWTCGPTARANYGGVGGHVRIYTEDKEPANANANGPEPPNANANASAADPPPANAPAPEPPPANANAPVVEDDDVPDLEPHGFSLGGGGGAEYRDFTRLGCAGECDAADVIPPARLLGAGRANLGFDWDYFGFRAGALVFQHWADNQDRSPTTMVLPDAELRFGRRAGFHGGLGLGAYSVTTIFRPGAFLALGYASGAWAADLRGGIHAVFDDQLGARVDASMRYGISRAVAPGLGLAVTGAEQLTPEGRLFVVFTP